MQGSMPGARSW